MFLLCSSPTRKSKVSGIFTISMSSDLFIHESDLQFMSSDLLLPFGDDPTPIDSPDILLHNPIDQLLAASNYTILLSSSPPCQQFESLSLCRGVSSEFPGGLSDHSSCSFGVDQEGPVKGDRSPAGPHSYGGHESGGSNVMKYMQRSYNGHLFEEKPMAALYRPQFDAVMDSPEFQGLQSMVGSPESCFLGAQMRRVCSTGDLQRTSLTSPLGMESSFMDEASMKVGRYSAEERKERILKYKAKRTQRNFTKTIKYACRKALADNRPRIRGRFARNDEVGELPKAPSSARDDDDYGPDHIWLGLQEDDGFGTRRGEPFHGNSYGQTQYHFSYGYQY